MTPYWSDETVALHLGDCIEVLAGMGTASVDAVVTDPPYGLEFMGKDWDAPWAARQGVGEHNAGFSPGAPAVPGVRGAIKSLPSFTGTTNPTCRTCGGTRNGNDRQSRRRCRCDQPDFPNVTLPRMHAFQAWCEEWAAECMRVLKPGGYMLAAGSSRTFHRLVCAVEDSGFEIRDTITHHYGSGFPKSRDISSDLRKLPSCTCDVPDEIGSVNASQPAGTIGTGVGAEAGSVPLAGVAADAAGRVGPDVSAHAANSSAGVQGVVKDRVRDSLPVVLGSTAVTADAQRDQVSEVVGSVQIEPESLRDQVVGDEATDGPAVATLPITRDDVRGDHAPASALVVPLASPPGRVAARSEAITVGRGHALAGAVDAGVRPAAELPAADSADVDAVSGAFHGGHSTAERPTRCEACGGVRGVIPDGLGTALKPATEFWTVARKPLGGTVAGNVLTHGTGALNIDGCRVAATPGDYAHVPNDLGKRDDETDWRFEARKVPPNEAGRWPPNVLLGPDAAAELDRQSGASTSRVGRPRESGKPGDGYGMTHTGAEYDDQGGASRFFPVFRYEAKAGSAERPRGDDGTAHPTVKPVDLMAWLVRLVTPPGGLVLDPFAGSGTTAEACIVEGFRCVLIEKDPAYAELIRKRLRKDIQPSMFGGAA